MNVRIISGQYGGRVLDAPPGRTTHPMGERIRGSLFNILGSRVEGARVLDAFAGTGALGIEALSRGAEHATFVERDKLAFSILQKNLDLLHIEDAAPTKASLGAWVETYDGPLFDFIFADPPYNQPQDTLITRLGEKLAPGGQLILSRASRHHPRIDMLALTHSRLYGDAALDIYE